MTQLNNSLNDNDRALLHAMRLNRFTQRINNLERYEIDIQKQVLLLEVQPQHATAATAELPNLFSLAHIILGVSSIVLSTSSEFIMEYSLRTRGRVKESITNW